jgi:hypothetical protein
MLANLHQTIWQHIPVDILGNYVLQVEALQSSKMSVKQPSYHTTQHSIKKNKFQSVFFITTTVTDSKSMFSLANINVHNLLCPAGL